MLNTITQFQYQNKTGNEHIWTGRSSDSNVGCLLTGTLLGSEVIRIRALRGTHLAASRYQLTDSSAGTLPYHSWIVATGDEQWPAFLDETQQRTALEPYLQGFASSPTAIRLARPLASQEPISALAEPTGTMNNLDPPS